MPPVADNGEELTHEEFAAIRSLQRLAVRWPKTIMVVSMDGNLCVVHASRYHAVSDLAGIIRQECILANIDGIPNDGGAW